MSDPVLTVRGARKRHGLRPALDGLDLELRAGEWVALLGPNGAGKTTLMRAVAALAPLDQGLAEVAGRSVGRRTRSLVGFVPQEIALYGALTARENLEVFARWHGLAPEAIDERADWALEWTGLTGRAGDRVETFSGGMRRRLNVACGVLHRPRLVLLDEPTVGVDPQARRRLAEMLRALRDEGAALLQSTHQLEEVEQACDRIVIVDHGRVVAEGELDELVTGALGGGRRVELLLAREPAAADVPAGFRAEGLRLRGALEEVARELPELLTRLSTAGHEVRDLRVEAPSLESVLLALTGGELRE